MDGFEILETEQVKQAEREELSSRGAHTDLHHNDMDQQMRQRAMEHRQRDESERRAIRERDAYVMQETTEKEDEAYVKNKAQKEYQLEKSNRQIAKEVFGGEVYDAADEARKGTAEERTVNIHHSRGNRFLAKGEQVLEIDIAGSGFSQPWREHHGNVNWNQFGRNEGKEGDAFSKFLDAEYGKQVEGREHVREKTTELTLEDGTTMSKKRISIAGPGALNSRTDDYSINHTREYAGDRISEFLQPILEDYNRQLKENPNAQLKDIHIHITGHSRGAVAAGETVKLSYEWLSRQEQYKDVAKYVKYDLIQRDPVPGYGDYTEHGKLELNGISNLTSTVVYSLAQEHGDKTFKPQQVSGTGRLIFGVMAHSAGLEGADLSQMTVEGDQEAHKRGFYDVGTGEFYRGSGVSELPKGIYFTDEKLNLIRVDSLSQITKLADAAFEGKDGLQGRRLNIVKNAAKDWLIHNDIESSYTNDIQREQALENLERTKASILGSKDAQLKGIQEGICSLDAAQKSGEEAAIRNAQRMLRDQCRDYMKRTELPNREAVTAETKQLDIVSDLLSGVQKEYNYLTKGYDKQIGKVKTGGDERQLARDEERIAKAGVAKGVILETAAESKELLEQLEATRKKGSNSKEYQALHDALQKVSELNGKSTIKESGEALAALERAGKQYAESHSGFFSANSKDGKERLRLSKLAGALAEKSGKEFKEQTKEIANKENRLDDQLNRQGETVDRAQKKVKDGQHRQMKPEEIKKLIKGDAPQHRERSRSVSAPARAKTTEEPAKSSAGKR